MYRYKRGWLRAHVCPCPKKKKNKFAINLFKNKVSCFICGSLGKPINFAIEHGDFNTESDFLKELTKLQGVEYSEPPVALKSQKRVNLPESFKLLSLGTNQFAKSARAYMKSRGYDILNLTMKGIGYCTKGDYQGMIVFPFYQNHELIYLSARNFIGDKFFKFPEVEQFNIGKNQLIHNIDALHLYNKIYITESITNELTIGDNAISIGGKIASSWQVSTLISAPVKYYVILLDPDAYQEALELACKLSRYKGVKVVKLPKDEDVNSIGRKATMTLIKKHEYKSNAQFQIEYTLLPNKRRYETNTSNTY